MNDERFLDLISVFETVPESQFEMKFWLNECGTVGCIIGHYCKNRPNAELKLRKDWVRSLWTWFPRLDGLELGWAPKVLSLYFDIREKDAEFLFCPPTSYTKSQALANLINYYNKHAKTPLPLHEVPKFSETLSLEGALK